MFSARSLLLSLVYFPPIFLAQEFQFPSDSEDTANITKLLEQKRGTENYEDLVDSVISRGILKLTLALDRATLSNIEQTSDNIVFSPISVAGNFLFFDFSHIYFEFTVYLFFFNYEHNEHRLFNFIRRSKSKEAQELHSLIL